MIGDAQSERISRARRGVEPNPELRGLARAEESDRPAAALAQRVHVQLRKQVEAGPADRAAGGEPHRGRRRESEPLGDRRLDSVGVELERVSSPRCRRRGVVEVFGAPELGHHLHFRSLATTAQQRDGLFVFGIDHEHQVLTVLTLDVRIEEPVRIAVQQRLHQRGLLDLMAVDQVVDGVAQDAGTLAHNGLRAEGELPLDLGQGGVGENERHRRDRRIHRGILEQALQLHPFDGERRRHRDGATSYERRSDRATSHWRREKEIPVLEVERDDVASQRQVPHRRDPIAPWLHLPQPVEYGLVAHHTRIRSLRAGERERAAAEQQRGCQEGQSSSQADRPERDSGNVVYGRRFSEGVCAARRGGNAAATPRAPARTRSAAGARRRPVAGRRTASPRSS